MPQHPAQLAIWTTTWLLCGLVFVLILWRPRRIPEYVWAVTGAVLLVMFRLLPVRAAWAAVRSGTDVYFFLAGMMLLAELARNHGVFDWLAGEAMAHARGSQTRLFVLVYGIGIVVTALLSNDATAVLLTPAVLAVVTSSRVPSLPTQPALFCRYRIRRTWLSSTVSYRHSSDGCASFCFLPSPRSQ
jgi:arsenical pump membrane protein